MSTRIALRTLMITSVATTALAAAVAPQGKGGDTPKVIEIHAKRFSYSPSEITLKKGETYDLHLTSDDVPHSLRIKALNFKADMKPNQFNDVLFTPEQVGDFKGDCSVYCGSGHKDMSMTIHVVN